MYPKISVITPSYNQGQFLEECINSVLRQNYPNLEYIVIDGGSTDESVEIIKKYESKITYWVSEKDNGQSDAINKGFSRATGDIIAWLNSDDLYYERSLWKVAEIYNRNREQIDRVGFILGNGYRYRWPEKSMSRFCPKNVAFSRKVLAEGLDYILQPSVFVIRDAAERAGYLKESLHYCMDWEWWFRLSREHQVIVTDHMLSLSREYDETKTSTGKMRRWIEIQQLTQAMSGKEMTAGGLFFLAETLKGLDAELINDAHLGGLWEDARVGLRRLCDQQDSFPYESDENTIVDVPICCEAGGDDIPKLERYPKITIVTPSYNQAEYLERTIQSVLSQKYPNLEYIIFDGGSTDGSVDIIKKYEDLLTFWKSEKDEGPADAINKGLKMATGEIIGWLNSDDVFTKDSLFRVAQKYLEGAQVLYGHALYVDKNDVPVAMDHGYQKTKIYLGYQQDFNQTIKYWQTIYMIPQPTVFWRKELMENYGLPNAKYKFIFDYEYFLRFTQKGIGFSLIDEVQALYRIHNESKTSSFDAFYEELYEHSRSNLKWDKEYKISFFKYYKGKIDARSGALKGLKKLRNTVFLAYEFAKVWMGWGNPERDYNRKRR